jgi:hypothetical protein
MPHEIHATLGIEAETVIEWCFLHLLTAPTLPYFVN